MRVNVYAKELTNEVTKVHATADTGKVFSGIRFMLESSDKLHHTQADDDRSAVTIWGPKDTLRELFTKALDLLSVNSAGVPK